MLHVHFSFCWRSSAACAAFNMLSRPCSVRTELLPICAHRSPMTLWKTSCKATRILALGSSYQHHQERYETWDSKTSPVVNVTLLCCEIVCRAILSSDLSEAMRLCSRFSWFIGISQMINLHASDIHATHLIDTHRQSMLVNAHFRGTWHFLSQLQFSLIYAVWPEHVASSQMNIHDFPLILKEDILENLICISIIFHIWLTYS